MKNQKAIEDAFCAMLDLLRAYDRGDYHDAVAGLTQQFDVDVKEAIRKAEPAPYSE